MIFLRLKGGVDSDSEKIKDWKCIKLKKLVIAAVLSIGVFSLVACSLDEEGTDAKNNADSEVIVELSVGENITKEDFYQELKKLHGKDVLAQMVTEVVLSEKYEVKQEEIDYEVGKLKEQLGEEFEIWLEQRGFKDEKTFRDFARISMLSEKAVFDNVEVSEEEMKERYNRLKTEINARHILVKDEETAKKVKGELDKGSDFTKLAKEYSTDTTAEEGGNLGFFSSGQMVPEFEEAAYGLEIEEISHPVQSQHGFHIIKLIGKRDKEGFESYEEKKGDLHREIQSSKIEPAVGQEKIDKLLKDAGINVKIDGFEELFTKVDKN